MFHSNSMRNVLFKIEAPFDTEDKKKQYSYYLRFDRHAKFTTIHLKIHPIYKCIFKTYGKKLNILENHILVYEYGMACYQWIHWLVRECGFMPVTDFYDILIHPQQTQASIYYQSGGGARHHGIPTVYRIIENQIKPLYIVCFSHAGNRVFRLVAKILGMSKKRLLRLCWMKFIFAYTRFDRSDLLTKTENEILNILDYYPTIQEFEQNLIGMNNNILNTHKIFYTHVKDLLFNKNADIPKIKRYLNNLIRRNTNVRRQDGETIKKNKR